MKKFGLIALLIGSVPAQVWAGGSSYTNIQVLEGNCGPVAKTQSGASITSANASLTESYSHLLIANNKSGETRYVIFPFGQTKSEIEKQTVWAKDGQFDSLLDDGTFDSTGTLVSTENTSDPSSDATWISKSNLENQGSSFKVNLETDFMAISKTDPSVKQEIKFTQTCNF